MIKRQDLVLMREKPVLVANSISITASTSIASRPSGVIIRTRNNALEIPDFAGLHIDRTFELQPNCEVVHWNDTIYILGLPAIVRAHEGGLLKIDLFRKPTDDSGFYVTEWLEDNGHLFCIYEGGIIAFGFYGDMLWHTPKAWDDIFTGLEKGDLILMESDGQIVAIDASNGSRKPTPE